MTPTIHPLLQSRTVAIDATVTSSSQLPEFMQHQQQANWCWAANGTSVGVLFHGSGSYTQCGIAQTCLDRSDCCASPGNCNVYGYLDKALIAADSYQGKQQGACDYDRVKSEIDEGQPVGNRVAWATGGAHFTMITGYDDHGGDPRITIQDPWYGTSDMEFSAYPGRYHSGGTWTHTYYTLKP